MPIDSDINAGRFDSGYGGRTGYGPRDDDEDFGMLDPTYSAWSIEEQLGLSPDPAEEIAEAPAEEAPVEEEPFEWNWSVMLLGAVPGLVINAIRAISHYIKQNPGKTKSEAYEALKSEGHESVTGVSRQDVLSEDEDGDYWSSYINEAIEDSDATDDQKEEILGNGEDDGLLSEKQVRKRGMNWLFNEMTTDSRYDTAVRDMGLRSADNWNYYLDQMESGNFKLPAWMEKRSNDSWKRFTEATTRKGGGPGSTAYAQGAGEWRYNDAMAAETYGLNMLGMSYEQAMGPFESLNRNATNQYNSLFNQGAGAGSADSRDSFPKEEDEKWWETALKMGGDALTGYGSLKLGGII